MMNNNFHLINQLLEDGSEASILKLKMIVDFSNKDNNYLFYSKIKSHLREKFYYIFKDCNIQYYDCWSNTTTTNLKDLYHTLSRFKMKKSEETKRSKYYSDEFALPPECNKLCLVRNCFHKYENKGTFSVRRGYTSYYEEFKPACCTRMNHGCPDTRDKEYEEFELEKVKEFLAKDKLPKHLKKILLELIENGRCK